MSGAGVLGEHRFAQYDALHLGAAETARIEALETSELLVMPHPVLEKP